MKIKIGTHHLDNFFDKVSGTPWPNSSSEAVQVLKDVDRLNTLLENTSYAGTVGEEITALLNNYFLHHADNNRNSWFIINEARKKLFNRKRDKTGLILLPRGRSEWFGRVELSRELVSKANTGQPARVIQAVKADVLCVVEVEYRLPFDRFNQLLLPAFNSTYAYHTVNGSSPEQGIDIGILTNLEIHATGSHVNDTLRGNDEKNHIIFSRDCAEYEIRLSNGQVIWLLCNHFKSKKKGSSATSRAKRVIEIISHFDLTRDLVVVAGDSHGTPEFPIPSLVPMPNLNHVLASPLHTGSQATHFQRNEKTDYLLVSQPLFDHLTRVGIGERGLFKQSDQQFSEVMSNAAQASRQAAVWAEFDLP